jgi:hypothetical protein
MPNEITIFANDQACLPSSKPSIASVNETMEDVSASHNVFNCIIVNNDQRQAISWVGHRREAVVLSWQWQGTITVENF